MCVFRWSRCRPNRPRAAACWMPLPRTCRCCSGSRHWRTHRLLAYHTPCSVVFRCLNVTRESTAFSFRTLERPFVRCDAEHRDEDASGSSPPVALCIHHSSSEGDMMNAFHDSFLLGKEREDGGETNRQSPKPLLRSLRADSSIALESRCLREFMCVYYVKCVNIIRVM